MRVNRFVAQATGMSRRAADKIIKAERVSINQKIARLGNEVKSTDSIALDGKPIVVANKSTTIMLNKPVGYVSSRKGQGSKTIYELLPEKYHGLKPVGRLDKDSSGLLLLTDDGVMANKLTHPRYQKEKIYQVELNKPLEQNDEKQLLTGVELEDGLSKFITVKKFSDKGIEVIISEGRNRQIRRAFSLLGYEVIGLNRTSFGKYDLSGLPSGGYQELTLDVHPEYPKA